MVCKHAAKFVPDLESALHNEWNAIEIYSFGEKGDANSQTINDALRVYGHMLRLVAAHQNVYLLPQLLGRSGVARSPLVSATCLRDAVASKPG
eukprot:1608864-Amphidinium_carterae.1